MIVATTLAERKYFLGLSALINSIALNGGYINKLVVGYRDDLPSWLPRLTSTGRGKACTLQSGIMIEFIEMTGNLHMVHEKPSWFKYFTDVLEPDADEYFFFDSDIVITTRMSFFGEWVKQGVAICEDVNYKMHRDHPIRKQWAAMANEEGIEIVSDVDWYYNSGFLGWTKHTKSFLSEWERCFEILARYSGNMKKFRVYDRTHAVLSANQDSFNLAIMITRNPISSIGPEAMGFFPGLLLMSHPIGRKPWNINYFLEFLNGIKPRNSDLAFWKHVNGSELSPMSPLRVSSKIFFVKLFRFCSRFYSRN